MRSFARLLSSCAEFGHRAAVSLRELTIADGKGTQTGPSFLALHMPTPDVARRAPSGTCEDRNYRSPMRFSRRLRAAEWVALRSACRLAIPQLVFQIADVFQQYGVAGRRFQGEAELEERLLGLLAPTDWRPGKRAPPTAPQRYQKTLKRRNFWGSSWKSLKVLRISLAAPFRLSNISDELKIGMAFTSSTF